MRLLQMSLSGAVMIVLAAAVRAAALHRLPKRVFPVLWGIVLARLLLPFSVPGVWSVYAWLGQSWPVSGQAAAAGALPAAAFKADGVSPVLTAVEQGGAPLFSAAQGIASRFFPAAMQGTLSPFSSSAEQGTILLLGVSAFPLVPLLSALWALGAAACLLYFALPYGKWLREFRTALPVENDFIRRWQEAHPLRRTIFIRQLASCGAPLTYGVFRPVILLPPDAVREQAALPYILEHEYAHIRRFDALTKLALAAAVCLHWFNPLVWAMYFAANRDMELACDEAALRRLGRGARAPYARALLEAAARRSGTSWQYSYFGRNALEERIAAMMKMKKTTAAGIVASGLVIGVSLLALLATAPGGGQNAGRAGRVDSASGAAETWVTAGPVLAERGAERQIYSAQSEAAQMLPEQSLAADSLMEEAVQWENVSAARITEDTGTAATEARSVIIGHPVSAYAVTLIDEQGNKVLDGTYSSKKRGSRRSGSAVGSRCGAARCRRNTRTRRLSSSGRICKISNPVRCRKKRGSLCGNDRNAICHEKAPEVYLASGAVF